MYSAANGQHVNKNIFEFQVFGGRGGRNFVPSRRRDNSVGTVTRVGAVSIPSRVQGFFFVPQAPGQTVEPFQPPKIGTWGSGTNPTSHLYLMPEFIMSGAVPPLSNVPS